MLKPIVTGVTVCAATLTAAGIVQHLADAQVQAPLVPSQCPDQPAWTAGFQFYELIPTAAGEIKMATVNADIANVRRGAGMESAVESTLKRGAEVMITGEAWDRGCNQWMQVQTDRGRFWMHGDFLQLQPFGDYEPPGPVQPPIQPKGAPLQTLITDVCPNTPWTKGFHFYELIALKESQYRPSVVTANEVRLRAGVGFDAPEVKQLSKGTPVIVTGEAWDSACNQWMQVQVEGDRNWVSGKHIQ